MPQSTESLFQERLTRIENAIALKPVDRIPIIYNWSAFSAHWMGRTVHEFCTDPEVALSTNIGALQRVGDVDGYNLPPSGYQTMNLTGVWLSKVLLPGVDLPENSLWQVEEHANMEDGDYDFIIDKGWPAFREKMLDKVLPPDRSMWNANLQWRKEQAASVPVRLREAGYVALSFANCTIPFEPLCGARSLTRFVMDLYRMPDKVQAVMDVILPHLVEQALMLGAISECKRVWLGGWRSASAMLSPPLWNRFVFPYFLEMAERCVAAGITPVFHMDQDWGRDLHRFKEMPARKCIFHTDGMTDLRLAKKILGGHMALMGDVPPALFVTGTPGDVRDYIRDLIRDVGPDGFILSPGCDGPYNTKEENLLAFVEAGREFGQL